MSTESESGQPAQPNRDQCFYCLAPIRQFVDALPLWEWRLCPGPGCDVEYQQTPTELRTRRRFFQIGRR